MVADFGGWLEVRPALMLSHKVAVSECGVLLCVVLQLLVCLSRARGLEFHRGRFVTSLKACEG